MFDLKVIHSVLQEMEDERGIPRAKMIDAIEQSLATAYKKEFGVIDETVKTNLQLWYHNDKGITTQNELLQLMRELDKSTI